jgi:hypothetical protein
MKKHVPEQFPEKSRGESFRYDWYDLSGGIENFVK